MSGTGPTWRSGLGGRAGSIASVAPVVARRLAVLILATLGALGACGGDENRVVPSSPPPVQEPESGPEPGEIREVETPPLTQRSYEEIRRALVGAGLTICDENQTGGNLSGAYEGHTYNVALGPCPSSRDDPIQQGHGLISVDAYQTKASRDKAGIEGFGDDFLSFIYGQFVVETFETSQPKVVEAFEKAMESLGAMKGLDRRGS